VAGGLSSGLSRAASGTGAAMRASAPQLAGTVSVRVVRATGLLAADRGGTSDPYVVVQSAGGKKAKTSVKKRTLDPEWDETLELSVYDASAPLSFAVWDHDKVCTPKPSLCGPNPRPNPGPKLKLNHDKARAP
jgi:hypothetical protein